MTHTIEQVLIWGAALLLLILYIQRRRKRKSLE